MRLGCWLALCAFTTATLTNVASAEDDAADALLCARAIVPSLDDIVPLGWAATGSHMAPFGPWDLRCADGLSGFAQSEHCHKLVESNLVTGDMEVRDPNAASWIHLCSEEIDAFDQRLLHCLSGAPFSGGVAASRRAVQTQLLFCALIGTCGVDAYRALCRAVILPTSRFIAETCRYDRLALHKQNCFRQWALDASQLSRALEQMKERGDPVCGPLTAAQEKKQRLLLLSLMADKIAQRGGSGGWDRWIQSLNETLTALRTVPETIVSNSSSSSGLVSPFLFHVPTVTLSNETALNDTLWQYSAHLE